MTSVNFGFTLNVTILIIYITGIIKTVMNPGIELHRILQQVSFQLCQVTKTSWLIALALIVISHGGKI